METQLLQMIIISSVFVTVLVFLLIMIGRKNRGIDKRDVLIATAEGIIDKKNIALNHAVEAFHEEKEASKKLEVVLNQYRPGIMNLRSKNITLETRLEKAAKEYKLLRLDNERVNKKLGSLSTKIMKLEKQIDQKDVELSEQEAKISFQEKEIKELKKGIGKLVDEAKAYGEHLRDEPVCLEYLGFEESVLPMEDGGSSKIFSYKGYSLSRREGNAWIIIRPDQSVVTFEVCNMFEMIMALQLFGAPVTIETLTKNTEDINSINEAVAETHDKIMNNRKKSKNYVKCSDKRIPEGTFSSSSKAVSVEKANETENHVVRCESRYWVVSLDVKEKFDKFVECSDERIPKRTYSTTSKKQATVVATRENKNLIRIDNRYWVVTDEVFIEVNNTKS